ncbi:hypothetical protein LAC81_15005 [Ensifer adhaerens]|uniref:hypothetical protein n=1 Tax=Ensifer adhaerens TaxID=106592 RepID=UPI001CBBC66A|nr:hypothetical protein [Ensifer adhaerens]MBZ7923098.1 hypothetical protein [Ensifer adhaerens]UAX91688.1 hypothetical protein LAC78_15000 [Ensifer adhaerens]UAX99316.1 hypothetical protein LAC80_15005 [Ensifer adhaerens]UAY06699.1 hypothetical protein LAC81_15005 [Ensifer adhaerens]
MSENPLTNYLAYPGGDRSLLVDALGGLGLLRSDASQDFSDEDKSVIRSNIGAASLEQGSLAETALQPGDVGTGTGTVAAGDDARIEGAMQKPQNLADLDDKGAAQDNIQVGAIFADVSTAQGATIAARNKRLRTQFYATANRNGGANYRRESLANLGSYPALSYFRSTDRFMPDESTDGTNGGYWVIDEPVIFAEMLGAATSAAAAINSSAFNAAILVQHMRGGGEVRVDRPGTYLLGNTNPYPSASYPGLSESDANWWANRRAIWIPYDNITLRLGQGVVLKVGNGENCHAIQVGQFNLSMSGIGVPIPAISVRNSRVIGNGWQIDMNGSNQTPATGDKDHPAGFIAFTGSEDVELGGGWIYNSAYYGAAYEGGDGLPLGFKNCHVHDMTISGCKADGFDAKDFATLSKGNVIERVRIINCGDGGNDFLSPQSGIDVRGGWRVNDNDVEYTDVFTGARVGIRAQYALDFAESVNPTIVDNCRVLGNGRNAETVCFRTIGKGARLINSQGKGMAEGHRASAPNMIHQGNLMWDCDIDYRLIADVSAGWDADGTQLIGCIGRNSTTCFRVDGGVTAAKILGGEALSVTTALVDSGTGTGVRDVLGLVTYNKIALGTAVDVASTGRKTFTFNHGLPFTPDVKDVQFQAVRIAFDANLQWDSLMVTATSSSQISGELRVVVAGAAALTLQVTAEVAVKNL